MFTILVRFEDKAGKYPVVYDRELKRYVVSAQRFHDWDNVGSVLTKDLVSGLMGEVLDLNPKSVEVFPC